MVASLTSSGIAFGLSFLAGVVGALLGLGGGMFLVPLLTLLMGVGIDQAIGASIVSVIATSSGAAAAYVRDRITNIRLGMFLEIATTLGALTGAFLVGQVSKSLLFILFGLLMAYSAINMFQTRNAELPENVEEHPLAARLNLSGEYFDRALGRPVRYRVAGVPAGFISMFVAGVISGLLGIGSGAFKVLGMDMFMKLPMKVSSATSNFMIGVTAATSAGIYFARGVIHPGIAAPVALGVLAGAAVGTRVMARVRSVALRRLFVPALAYIAIEMFLKGLRG